MTTVPAHLSAASKGWMTTILDQVSAATETDVRLLALAAEAADRAATARRRLEKEGITYTDRFGSPKAHPCIAIERDSRAAFSRIVAQLGLDVHDDESPETYRGKSGRTYRGVKP
jgi:P27 family predicted phage terminase small subunit